MCNGIKKIKCAHRKCHTNINCTPPTQLPHKFSYIVAILIHNHFESPNSSFNEFVCKLGYKEPSLHTNELNTTFFCSTSPLKGPNRLKSLKLAWCLVLRNCDIYQNPFTREKILKFWQCRTKRVFTLYIISTFIVSWLPASANCLPWILCHMTDITFFYMSCQVNHPVSANYETKKTPIFFNCLDYQLL
jgi:hypothetical protein